MAVNLLVCKAKNVIISALHCCILKKYSIKNGTLIKSIQTINSVEKRLPENRRQISISLFFMGTDTHLQRANIKRLMVAV